MKLNFKHVCAFSTFLLAVTPAATTPFTHTQTLPVLSGYTASANWMTNGYNSDGTNCKVIVVGSHAPTYGSWKACYWVVTMNSSGYVGSTSETEMSGFADVSYATGVNEDGHVCGYGHIPGGGGIGMPAPAGGDSATAAGGDMPIGGGTNAPYAFVWKNMGTLSQPNYGTYNGYTNTLDYYPYLLSLQNGYAQYATAISKGVTTNTGYVCGSTSNSTPGWYQSLDYLFGHYNNTLSTNYDGPTVAPMDYCNCIDPVNHHIGGSGNLLKFNNARQNPPDYDTTATSVPQVSWWDGYVTWHPWVINALRGNSGGSSIT